jgi:hypothetical protein
MHLSNKRKKKMKNIELFLRYNSLGRQILAAVSQREVGIERQVARQLYEQCYKVDIRKFNQGKKRIPAKGYETSQAMRSPMSHVVSDFAEYRNDVFIEQQAQIIHLSNKKKKKMKIIDS